jgi:hypothetical protein
MPYSRPQLFELSKKVGRSWRTLQYWAAQGCDLNDPASLEAFLQAKELRRQTSKKAGNVAVLRPMHRRRVMQVESRIQPTHGQWRAAARREKGRSSRSGAPGDRRGTGTRQTPGGSKGRQRRSGSGMPGFLAEMQ